MKTSADNIRVLALSMVEKAKSGHPGGAMGGADFIDVLYGEFLKYDPDDPGYPWRDRFFLDPGHMSPMLYSVLFLCGYYSREDLENFRQWGSATPGHPERDLAHAIENTSGPLGQGHAMALGAAIAERFLAARFGEWCAHKTYAYLSDGGMQEEVSQGVGRIAGHLGLSNFIMYYDANDVQLSTTVHEVDTEDVAAKYRAWGWNVLEVDGRDAGAIRGALRLAVDEKEKPTLIIGRTVMACGAVAVDGGSMEGFVSTHGQPLSAAGASIDKTIENLGGDPADPFAVFPEVRERYGRRCVALQEWVAGRRRAEAEWREGNSALAGKLDMFMSGGVPVIDFDAIDVGHDVATRNASAAVLGVFAQKIENMIVASADLSNSDKTDGFLKKTRAFTRGDFGGQFFQAGVSELTMACVMNGMALHGGVIPVCGTFFVFSDYMKPAVRLAALQRLKVVWVWSHDSFRVGEDGPTHQPIEQEAQIRLMEQVRNHSGERSVVVLRPADGAETVEAWRFAVSCERPVALVLSRQNIADLPSGDGCGSDRGSGSRRADARGLERGAYVVGDYSTRNGVAACAADISAHHHPKGGADDFTLDSRVSGGGCDPTVDVVMIASGSEVATLVEGARLLAEDGVKVRVVSAPSEGLFRDQTVDYQRNVIPEGVPRYGLTSGLPVTLRGLVGDVVDQLCGGPCGGPCGDSAAGRGGSCGDLSSAADRETDHRPTNFIHGLDHFGYSAPYKVLDDKFGFSGENVYNQVKKLLSSQRRP